MARQFGEQDIGREFLITLGLGKEHAEREVRVRATLRGIDESGFRIEVHTPWLDRASERAWLETHSTQELGILLLSDEEIELAEPMDGGPPAGIANP
jgi:hypothetical protein